jgi:hypothetical protein
MNAGGFLFAFIMIVDGPQIFYDHYDERRYTIITNHKNLRSISISLTHLPLLQLK